MKKNYKVKIVFIIYGLLFILIFSVFILIFEINQYKILFYKLSIKESKYFRNKLLLNKINFHYNKKLKFIYVRKNKLYKTRYFLINEELFDNFTNFKVYEKVYFNPNQFASTPFDAKIILFRYMREEIYKTFNSLDNIKNAKVILKLKKQGNLISSEVDLIKVEVKSKRKLTNNEKNRMTFYIKTLFEKNSFKIKILEM